MSLYPSVQFLFPPISILLLHSPRTHHSARSTLPPVSPLVYFIPLPFSPYVCSDVYHKSALVYWYGTLSTDGQWTVYRCTSGHCPVDNVTNATDCDEQ